MLFNSLDYLIFFPIVVFTYFSLPEKHRNGFLLIASYYFYMSWKPVYAGLIFASTIIDYFCGLKMDDKQSILPRRFYLVFSLLGNLSILFTFKYFNFFTENLFGVLHFFDWSVSTPTLNVILPVGISFYTFQSLSYTIDTYMKKRDAEEDFLKFALYVSFFPQLVAGPIERSTHLLPQFDEDFNFDVERTLNGLKLIVWGFFKKIVIADQLAIFVNQIYGAPETFGGAHLLVATIFFSFQIYCDFSGYSDIAIGSARILGFDIMENFHRPYFAKSIPEFWIRWHISLSTWFKDYVYIPLGGNRVNSYRHYFNLAAVFLISGLWHGAAWTFVIWGAIHAVYYLVHLWKKPLDETVNQLVSNPLLKGIRSFTRIVVTFGLVTFSWVFFRAQTLEDAILIVKKITYSLGNYSVLLSQLGELKQFLDSGQSNLALFDFSFGVLAVLFMLIIHILERGTDSREFISDLPGVVRIVIYNIVFIAILAVLLFGGTYEEQTFIYFQF